MPSKKPNKGGSISATEIAKAWGCSRQYVSRAIKEKGCPTSSLEAANSWRAATQQRGAGYRSKHGGAVPFLDRVPEILPTAAITVTVGAQLNQPELLSLLAAAGFERVEKVSLPGQFAIRGEILDVFSHSQPLPFRIELNGVVVDSLHAFDLDDASQTTPFDEVEISLLHPKAPPAALPAKSKPAAAPKTCFDLMSSSDIEGSDLPSLEESLRRVIKIEMQAADLVDDAQAAGNDQVIGIRISTFNKAMEARHKAEALFRKEMERRRILVPEAEARESSRQVIDLVLARLDSLPAQAGPAANPSDPIHATTIIGLSVKDIKKELLRLVESIA